MIINKVEYKYICRVFIVILLSLFLASCSKKANLDGVDLKNGCQILEYNPNWVEILKQTNAQNGVPSSFILAVIYQESKFNSSAKNKNSSAYGYAQVIDGTWKSYEKHIGHNANRDNFNDSVKFISWYFGYLKNKFNLKWNDKKDLYMAYILGEGGYKKYLSGHSNIRGISYAKKVSLNVSKLSLLYHNQLIDCKYFKQ